MEKNSNQTNKEQVFEEDLVKEVLDDFKTRQQERKSFETQWELNMNFLMGNQYCSIGPSGEVEEYDKQFYWQEREVYNHIAPIIESRLAKLINMFQRREMSAMLKLQKFPKKLLMLFITNFALAVLFRRRTIGAKFAEQVFIK